MSSEIVLKLLRIGHCVNPKALTQRGATWRLASFPALAAVIRHETHGSILFDSGYGAAFFAATKALPEKLYRWLTPVHLAPSESLPRQLAALGCAAPDLVILSHLHADHVAGLFDLAPQKRPIYASAKAIEALAKGRMASLRAGCPAGLRDALRALPLQPVENCPPIDLGAFDMAAFGRGRDILGDGSLIAVDLPGHGIGQFGLLIPKSTLGAVFLIADAAWSIEALRENRLPPAMVLRQLGDRSAYEETFARLRALSQRQPQLRLIPSHCGTSFDEVSR